jgi:hypothetical protein
VCGKDADMGISDFYIEKGLLDHAGFGVSWELFESPFSFIPA